MDFWNKMRTRLEARSERGSITEVMIGFILIGGVLTMFAGLMLNATNAQASGEARDKAVALAKSITEQTRAVEYQKLGFSEAQYEASQLDGGLGGDLSEPRQTYEGEKIVVLPAGSGDFQVQPYLETAVGQTDYKVRTYITYTRFGARSATLRTDAPAIKRVTVSVEWDTGAGRQTTASSFVITPSVNQCIPGKLIAEPFNTQIPACEAP